MKSRVSWLHLHLWIPQKDVRKLIYALLDAADRVMVECAHNRTRAPTLSIETTVICAARGYLNLLQLIPEYDLYGTTYICEYAALGGHLDIIDWARARECRMDENTCAYAARGGHLDVIEHVRSKYSCPWDVFTTAEAARNGHLEILEYAVVNGCPIDKDFCLRYNHVHIREWIMGLNQ